MTSLEAWSKNVESSSSALDNVAILSAKSVKMWVSVNVLARVTALDISSVVFTDSDIYLESVSILDTPSATVCVSDSVLMK